MQFLLIAKLLLLNLSVQKEDVSYRQQKVKYIYFEKKLSLIMAIKVSLKQNSKQTRVCNPTGHINLCYKETNRSSFRV